MGYVSITHRTESTMVITVAKDEFSWVFFFLKKHVQLKDIINIFNYHVYCFM